MKPAKEIDESAAVVVGYGMVPLMKSSRAKPGSFDDRSPDSSSCARTVCPFFRSALSHAAPLFSDVAGCFAPCIVNPISHKKNVHVCTFKTLPCMPSKRLSLLIFIALFISIFSQLFVLNSLFSSLRFSLILSSCLSLFLSQ